MFCLLISRSILCIVLQESVGMYKFPFALYLIRIQDKLPILAYYTFLLLIKNIRRCSISQHTYISHHPPHYNPCFNCEKKKRALFLTTGKKSAAHHSANFLPCRCRDLNPIVELSRTNNKIYTERSRYYMH